MGPPPFGDGYLDAIKALKGDFEAASMGPPPFGDGYMVTAVNSGTAAMTLQWGHRLSAMDTGSRLTDRSRVPCFNGATAFRRWILGRRDRARTPFLIASMGPPPFGDGYPTGRTPSRSRCTRLQWGHRLSAMDTSLCLVQARHLPRASMGPPPFGDGYSPKPARSARGWCRFNGATAFRRWIQDLIIGRWAQATVLQWGHRLSAMDTAPASSAPQSSASFNGATAFRRWIRPPTHTRWCSCCRFNGATAFRRWIRTAPRCGIRLGQRLQWGHRLSAMDTQVGGIGVMPFGKASMGPPPFGDGYAVRANTLDTRPTLQWGHRLSAMDTK